MEKVVTVEVILDGGISFDTQYKVEYNEEDELKAVLTVARHNFQKGLREPNSQGFITLELTDKNIVSFPPHKVLAVKFFEL